MLLSTGIILLSIPLGTIIRQRGKIDDKMGRLEQLW